jgi:chromosome segregation ATPase
MSRLNLEMQKVKQQYRRGLQQARETKQTISRLTHIMENLHAESCSVQHAHASELHRLKGMGFVLSQSHTQLAESQAALTEESKQMKVSMQAHEKRLNQHRAQLSRLLSGDRDLTAEIHRVKSSQGEIAREHEQKFHSVSGQMDDMQTKLRTNDQALQEAQAKVRKVIADVNFLEREKNSCFRMLEVLQTQYRVHWQSIHEFQEKARELEEKITSLKQQSEITDAERTRKSTSLESQLYGIKKNMRREQAALQKVRSRQAEHTRAVAKVSVELKKAKEVARLAYDAGQGQWKAHLHPPKTSGAYARNKRVAKAHAPMESGRSSSSSHSSSSHQSASSSSNSQGRNGPEDLL